MAGSKVKSVLLSNLRLKLIALVFATTLWFFVAGQSTTEVALFVPLGFKEIPSEMAVTGGPSEEVEVRVMGPRFFINNLTPSQLTAEVDLSSAREGQNTLKIQNDDVVAPIGLTVLRVRPSSVNVRLERLVKAELPVRPVITGRPANGYVVAEATVYPKVVLVTGTRKGIGGTAFVRTRNVDVGGLDRSKSFTAELDTDDAEYRSIDPDSVRVTITVRKER